MTDIKCLMCPKTYPNAIEFEMHWKHNHHGPVPLIKSATSTPEPEAPEEPTYSLAASKEGLGELYPVIKDKYGNIIDGFHRKGENANWREETLQWIDTPEKLEAARLAVNFARRKMAPEELAERIAFLIKSGLKAEEIANLTGIHVRKIYRHMPQDLKDTAKVEQGSIRNQPNINLADKMQFTNVNTAPDKHLINLNPPLGTTSTYTPKTSASTSTPELSEPEEPEEIPPNTPICPICHCSMDPTEYKEVKANVAKKYGKQIQTLLFPAKEGLVNPK